ncbi:MAG: EAL domain-containing protein [Sulfurimonas sp.]|nr:EAL domain-containing protein [Sulfurimonas sp.]
MFKIQEEMYIQEIQTWKNASKIHAKKAIEQYKEVVKHLDSLEDEKNRNEALMDNLSDIVIVVDEDFNIVLFNLLACSVFELSSKNIIGHRLTEYSNLQTVFTLFTNQNIENIFYNTHYYKTDVNEILFNNKKHFILLLSDITEIYNLKELLKNEKKSLERRVEIRTQELSDIAMNDSLTQLPNRNAFNQKLDALMQRDPKNGNFNFTLLFIDIDAFKAVNDTYGHMTGDELLIVFSNYLRKYVRGNDFIARLGGDEFVIILENIPKKSIVEKLAKNLLKISSENIIINDISLDISLSIGILMNPASDLSASMLLSMADKAMYAVKYNGKNSYKFFNEVLAKEFQRKIDLVEKLHNAFKNEEFYLVYQPICKGDKGHVSCEVLARWNHGGENISPVEFIQLLEEQGMINKFTYYIIDHIFSICNDEKFPICVSINLSLHQFDDENFVSYLEEKVKMNPDFSKKVNFEITENVFGKKDALILDTLTKMRKLGFKIYIDDFGTGYSSFDYIRKYPIDVLKIDKVFVDEILEDERQYKLLKGMISLAHSLDMQVIIEGIESKEQYEYIMALKYNVSYQGYYFYKPMLLEELYKL